MNLSRILLFSIGSLALATGAYWTGYKRSEGEVRSIIGHSPFVEEPGRFLRMLIEDVLPLAADPNAGKPR